MQKGVRTNPTAAEGLTSWQLPDRAMSQTIQDAFDRLSSSISSDDARDFNSTTLQDVRREIQAIEQRQAQRQSLQNVRRIQPFLNFAECYSGVLDTICQGFSPIAWVWGPIKLMLRLASQYANIFESLLEAYRQIAEELPRVDRLRRVYGNNRGFYDAMGLLYADITEFHRRTYKLFRRRAWHILFVAAWRNFECRFRGILSSIRRHADLIDREAASIHFLEAREATQRAEQEIKEKERQRRIIELREVKYWLSADSYQEQKLQDTSSVRQPGTCEWFLQHDTVVSWLHQGPSRPIIWLYGIPGAGEWLEESLLPKKGVD